MSKVLKLPETGIRTSKSTHNSDYSIACDWLEASVMFHGEIVTVSDYVDCLWDEQIYSDQDLAREFASHIKDIVSARAATTAHYPIDVHGNNFKPRSSWMDFPEYSFLLLLSLYSEYPKWSEAREIDSNRRGNLFARLCHCSLEQLFPDWKVSSVGAASDKPTLLRDVIAEVSQSICEGSIPNSVRENSAHDPINTSNRARAGSVQAGNDGGLDIYCHYSFGDRKGGHPLFLIQCASGGDWKTKFDTPSIEEWRGYIMMAFSPIRAITIPFSLEERDFRNFNRKFGGLLLDRLRLYSSLIPNQDSRLADELRESMSSAIDNAPAQ